MTQVSNRGRGNMNRSTSHPVNITCTPHQSPLYLQTPPDNKKPKLNRDAKARRSSRYWLFISFRVFRCCCFWSSQYHFVYGRHRKQRGEVSLTVGSTETLRDVKIQVKQILTINIISPYLTNQYIVTNYSHLSP